MLTEAEQLSLDRARNNVRSICKAVLEDLPAEGSDICRGDFLVVVVLAIGGGHVNEYSHLVQALKEPLIDSIKAGK